MNIYIGTDKQDMAQHAADAAAAKIREAIAARGEARIIVATGASQFEFLAALVKEPGIDWTKVTGFHLDEYVGLPVSHKASFRGYMRERFVSKTPQPMKVFNEVDGEAADPAAECARLERLVREAPIDVACIGFGENGHIAFNEPGTSLSSRTSCVYLTPSTIKDNARLFFKGKEKEVPTRALSMGVGTICEAKKIILLAFGEGKQNAIKGCVEGPMTQFCTASALQAHNDCWIFCDEAAAKKLTLKKYYAWRSATKLGI